MALALAPEIDVAAGALIGITFTGLGWRGGGVLSSTYSGLVSGGAGGGVATGTSSGGGVGSGGASIVASTTAVGISERSSGGGSRFIAATTAPRCITTAPPRAVHRCHLGGGRNISGLAIPFPNVVSAPAGLPWQTRS